MKRLMVVLLLVLVGIGPVLAQGPVNLVENPSFEGPAFAQDGIGILQIVEGWRGFYKENQNHIDDWMPSGSSGDKIRRPEYKPLPLNVDPGRVHSGSQSQCLFVFSGVTAAGLYQRIFVGAGNTVQASVYLQSWASEGDDPAVNERSDMAGLIGIDPKGGENPWHPRIVRSDWYGVPAKGYGAPQWVQAESLPVIAATDYVTLFIYLNGRWASKHNDGYVDDAALWVVAGGTQPLPTYTPYPILTPRPTYTPFPTGTPCLVQTPQPTATCPVGGDGVDYVRIEQIVEDVVTRLVLYGVAGGR